MATARELKDVLKEALTKSGVLNEVRTRIRAEVFNVLQNESEPPPPISNTNQMINELIREYLIYNGYLFSESVLLSESGQPHLQLEREIIEDRLGLSSIADASGLPLLYSLISYFLKQKKPAATNT